MSALVVDSVISRPSNPPVAEVISFRVVLLGLGLFHFAGHGCHLWGPGGQRFSGPKRQDSRLRGDRAHHERAGTPVERGALPGGGLKVVSGRDFLHR